MKKVILIIAICLTASTASAAITAGQEQALKDNLVIYLMYSPSDVGVLVNSLSDKQKTELFNRMKIKRLELLNTQKANIESSITELD